MSSYLTFADYYDVLTENAQYSSRAKYITRLLKSAGVSSGILLDLCCGTGTLSFLLEGEGYDVVGVDSSFAMLERAVEKREQLGSSTLFLNQSAEDLDLFGTINACVCTLDSINHFNSLETVSRVFDRVGLFMEKGGVFVFDVNTHYKHEKVLADNAFTFEPEQGVFVAWQNSYCNDDSSVDISLDFFVEQDSGEYARFSEDFTEHYYSDEQLKGALQKAGFEVTAIFGDLTCVAPSDTEQRKVFVCKKIRQDNSED